jgi:hypothetical protein
MLTVIVPSRGRPEAALELVNAVVDTRQVSTTNMVLAVDADDPMLDLYQDVAGTRSDAARVEVVRGGWMVAALNEAAARVAADSSVTAIGFLGDDHRPRTPGWDASYLSALNEIGAGIVYGNDLLQYDFVPTQCAMSASIVRALGWMAHPSLKHMYVDTLWRDMANVARRLRYLPDVIVEHMHYLNGKSVQDDGYKRVNAAEVFSADEQAFQRLHASGQVKLAGAVIDYLARTALADRGR